MAEPLLSPGRSGRVLAVLGPTNTGKTHFAMERLAAHGSGMIGFPLRLLARENYERLVRLKGARAVALITGEEKILPDGARWFVCTVESMPLDRRVDCLAVDEIQLAADPERGHIFTDRLLYARGVHETLFLGAETMRPLLRRLVPEAEYVVRERLSELTYTGHRKPTRLRPRSAIVAFSTADVYGLAEVMRRQRGGTAVVLGALSPRTRNAQVELYQSGEVDYLVATDAIGMGLNMDIDHVAFARLSKFDGRGPRRLRAPEIAQIAGRAGRHTNDGTFGTTDEAGEIDPEIVEAVESHVFAPVEAVMWRNPQLDFSHPRALLRSLDVPPPLPVLLRPRLPDDQQALMALVRDEAVMALARTRPAVQLLWEVCQIPDFRKVMSDHHARLLAQIFGHLASRTAHLPADWVAQQVDRLDSVEGEIDALVTRLAHVRTWTYVAHRPGWLADPRHWQELTRALEDRLSDALHEKLTQRFVDRRAAMLVRRLKDGGEILAGVQGDGTVIVEGHAVGHLTGFRFSPDPGVAGEDARALLTAARRALKGEIQRRIARLVQEPDSAFALDDQGRILWQDAPVARLAAGGSPLAPALVPLPSDLMGSGDADRLRPRLAAWLATHLEARLGPLFALQAAAARPAGEEGGLGPAARGIAFQLVAGLGSLARAPVAPLIADLPPADRRRLMGLGVRFGCAYLWLPQLIRPQAVQLRALLFALAHGLALPPVVPAPGRVTVEAGAVSAAAGEAMGYPRAGARLVRVDMLDRLAGRLLAEARDGVFSGDAGQLAQGIGCPAAAFDDLAAALGWQRVEGVVADDAAEDSEDAVSPPISWQRDRRRDRAAARAARRPWVSDDHPFAALKEIAFAQ